MPVSHLDPELIELMLEEVTLEPVTGKDKYNNFTFGPPLSDGFASAGHCKCKIDQTNVRVLDVQGREVTSTVQVFLADPTLPIDTNTRMTLPDGSKPAIIQLRSSWDDVGPFYLEVRA